MTTVTTKKGRVIQIASSGDKSTLTASDREMDRRATEAVKAAIHRAKVCNKPIAGYDSESNRAYLEYPNGERKYAD